MTIYLVPIIAAVPLLAVGFLRARALGVRWRDTGWPGLTVALLLYLLSSLILAVAP